jgi:hypothetical protein
MVRGGKHRFRISNVGGTYQRFAAQTFDLLLDVLERLRVTRNEADPKACSRKTVDDGASDTGAGAGDDDDRSGRREISGHRKTIQSKGRHRGCQTVKLLRHDSVPEAGSSVQTYQGRARSARRIAIRRANPESRGVIMCNLYRVTTNQSAIAALFRVMDR